MRHFSVAQPNQTRPLGLAKNKIHIPDAFSDPLPDDILQTFTLADNDNLYSSPLTPAISADILL